MTPDDPLPSINRREADLRWEAHYREHSLHDDAHRREHEQTQLALDKAELQTSKALDKAEHTVSLRFDASSKTDDLMREQVAELRQTNATGAGKSLGQGTVIAAIVTGITVFATLLGILIVLANLSPT